MSVTITLHKHLENSATATIAPNRGMANASIKRQN